MTASEIERLIWGELLSAGLTPAGAAGLSKFSVTRILT